MNSLVADSNLDEAFRRNVKRRRIELGYTQTDLADRLGVKQPVVAMVESGRTSPTLKTVQQFAEALQMSPSELFSESSEKLDLAS
jgi:transcriptional regulator with XRE-family HTH domain